MSALVGSAVLALFALGIFVAIPLVLAPLVIGGMYLKRRRDLADGARVASSLDLVAGSDVVRAA